MSIFTASVKPHLRALRRSATVWLAAGVTAAPQMCEYTQQNFPALKPYIPAGLHDPVLHALGLAIFLARMRSLRLTAGEPPTVGAAS